MRVQAAFIGEGKFDDGLIPILEQLCIRMKPEIEIEIECGRQLLEVHDTKALAEKVQVLLTYFRYDLLFIHRDADKDGADARRGEIAGACSGTPHVPVIPIRETESWLLLDANAIRKVARNSKGRRPLELPKPGEVEDTNEAKERLKAALRNASVDGPKRRSGQVSEERLCAELLENLDIDGPVNQLSAWQALVRDTKIALAAFAVTRA